MPPSAEVRQVVAAFCRDRGVPAPGSAAREALILQVYLQVHCRVPAERDSWSEGSQALEYLDRARRLPVRPSRRHAFVDLGQVAGEGRVLTDADGIEVRVPAQARVMPGDGGFRLEVPPLALLQEGRWLQWTSPDAQPEDDADPHRVYLNVTPDRVYQTWSEVVLAADVARVPAAVKMITSRRDAVRADAVVVLTRAAYGPATLNLVKAVTGTGWLEQPVAGFCQPVTAGVGVATGPGVSGSSHGIGWATALVDALIAGPAQVRSALRRLDRACAPELSERLNGALE